MIVKKASPFLGLRDCENTNTGMVLEFWKFSLQGHREEK